MQRSIWIGFDPRETSAFAVARSSVRRHLSADIAVHGLVLEQLQKAGLYTRPTDVIVNSDGRRQLVDVLSKRTDYDGRISTWHANARFLVPYLAKAGWALFMDGDMLVRGDLARAFDDLDPSKAVYCVQHEFDPSASVKMDGQLQTRYARKNWSSFVIFNVDHPANKALTLDLVNGVPGRDLHAFCWLDDGEIGALDPKWNFLVGHSDASIDPVVVHHTDGVPDMPGYEAVAFSDEWRAQLNDWARGTLSFGS